ncbi:hypothetical protein HUJ04_001557 [Dendroctonus ponderosae]|nr:hypothetical protein HUJ04_001557 [Dendroctonus ponderosae]KAH1017107.1 hypothetical protein HUJ05_007819 [Dendroctonus ponderosae]
MGKSAALPKQGRFIMFFKGLYRNEFKWCVINCMWEVRALVKSIGIFALGVRIAQECQGIELVPS